MEKATQRAGGVAPDIILTDKLAAYLDGIEMTFGADTKHIPIKGLTAMMNTNLIERFHGTLKDRTKVMRGLKSMKTAGLLLDGWLVHYNFFRPHESLRGRTPAEAAGIEDADRDWMDVVRGAVPQDETDGDGGVSRDRLVLRHPRQTPTKRPRRLKSAQVSGTTAVTEARRAA